MKGNQFEFWHQALSLLAKRLPANIFDTIILDSKPASFENDKLSIIVPFTFMLRRITQSDKTILEAVLSEVIGKPVTVEFMVSTESDNIKSLRSAIDAQNTIAKRKAILNLDDDAGEAKRRAINHTRSSRSQSNENDSIPLNPQFTFDTFVVGENSLMAHAAAMSVARKPGTDYNPLFIYSAAGLGKTHMLHAIGQHALILNPELIIRLVPAETFTYELIDAIGDKASMKQFRSKYRRCDMLLIDDIHFLIDKEATQEAFFHTLNALFEMNKQVVITSDRHPRELRTLKERLVSRFQLGLVVDIQKPGFETRLAILKRKASLMNLEISNETLEIFAGEVQSSIRSLVGCLKSVKNHEESHRRKISVETAREIAESFRDNALGKDRLVTVSRIMDLICHHYRISLEELLSPSKEKRLAHPRHVAMYLARKNTNLTLMEITRAFRRNDHTTIHHGVKKIGALIERDAVFSREMSYIEEMLYGKSPRE